MQVRGSLGVWWLGCALALLSPTALIAQGSECTQTIARASPFIERQMARHQVVGLSVAVVDGKGPLWMGGFGYADRAAGRPAGADTLYRAGSITKLITAAAVMKLAERGSIDIDQPVARYLPGFRVKSRIPVATPITPRLLLSHRSGLPSDINKGLWTPTRFTSVLETLEDEYLAHPPGQVLSYSNVGFSVLGGLIESTTQQSFERYLHDEIFAPLGMTRSGFGLTPSLQSGLAKAYMAGEEMQPLPVRDTPAMGLYTSVQDLARFMAMLLNNGELAGRRVLQPATVAAMFERQNQDAALDFDDGVGLGFFVDEGDVRNAGPVLEHGGNTLYYGGHLVMAPRHGIGAVVLGNARGARQAGERIAEHILIEALRERHGVVQRSPEPRATPAGAIDIDQELARYVTDWGLLSIGRDDGELCACTADRRLGLLACPDGWLEVEAPGKRRVGSKVRIARQSVQGQDLLVAEVDGRVVRLGSRLPETTDHPAWRARLGGYRVLNPDPGFPVDSVCLCETDGLIQLRYRMPKLSEQAIVIPIQPLSADEAVTLGLGRSRGDTLRAVRVGGKEELLFSGYRLQREGGRGLWGWFD